MILFSVERKYYVYSPSVLIFDPQTQLYEYGIDIKLLRMPMEFVKLLTNTVAKAAQLNEGRG